MAHCIYWEVIGYYFQKNYVFLSLKNDFVLVNSADADEMTYYGAFHLGLHCLPKYLLRGFQYSKGVLALKCSIEQGLDKNTSFPSGLMHIQIYMEESSKI